MCSHITVAVSHHGYPNEKPAGEDVPGYVISHANREQREIVGLLSSRLGLHPLCHLSDTSLPLLDMGAMTQPPWNLGQELCSCNQAVTPGSGLHQWVRAAVVLPPHSRRSQCHLWIPLLVSRQLKASYHQKQQLPLAHCAPLSSASGYDVSKMSKMETSLI